MIVKKLFLVFALALSIGAYAQTKDTVKQVPVYAIILDSLQRDQLFAIIKAADIKPSEVTSVITFLMAKTQVLPVTTPPAAVSTQKTGTPANEAKKRQNN